MTAVKHSAAFQFANGFPVVDTAARQTFRKDMALTPAEFARCLGKAVPGVVTRIDTAGPGVVTRIDTAGPSYRVEDGDRVVLIHCMAMPHRRVGSLRIPRLDVEIELRGFDDAETRQFFNRFDLAFLRMGG